MIWAFLAQLVATALGTVVGGISLLGLLALTGFGLYNMIDYPTQARAVVLNEGAYRYD